MPLWPTNIITQNHSQWHDMHKWFYIGYESIIAIKLKFMVRSKSIILIKPLWNNNIESVLRLSVARCFSTRPSVVKSFILHLQGPLLLRWIDFHPSMDKWLRAQLSVRWIHLTIPCTVEVWKWMNNFTPQFMIDVITYPCWLKLIHISESDPKILWLLQD